MAIRRKIKGQYYDTRERSTSSGRRGTIMGKWSPPKPSSAQYNAARKSASGTAVKYKRALDLLGGEDRS